MRERERESTRDQEPSRERGRDRESSRDEGRSRNRDDDRGSRRGGSRFSYEERDPADTKKRSEQRGNSEFDRYLGDALKTYKVEDGDNCIRILPPTWKGAKHYGHDIYVHYGVGPDRQTYLCLNKMKNEPCPICEEREVVARGGDEDYAKELEARKRVLVYLIDRNKEKEGLQAWAMPWTVDRDICAVSTDKRSGAAIPIDHPEEGFDVFFKKRGQKNRTEYLGISIDRRESDLGDPTWIDEAMDAPLPEQLVYFSYDHIAKAFGGGGARRDTRRDEDDDKGRRGRNDDDRGRGRGQDNDDTRGREAERSTSRRREPDYDWTSIHKLEGDALDNFIEDEKLKLNPKDFKSDDELADAICEELGVKEERASAGGRDRDTGTTEKLRDMREKRDDGEGRRRSRD